jgi:hypothetical protein
MTETFSANVARFVGRSPARPAVKIPPRFSLFITDTNLTIKKKSDWNSKINFAASPGDQVVANVGLTTGGSRPPESVFWRRRPGGDPLSDLSHAGPGAVFMIIFYGSMNCVVED